MRYIDPSGLEPGDVVFLFPGGDWNGSGGSATVEGIKSTVMEDYISKEGGSIGVFPSHFWAVSPDNPSDLDEATNLAYKAIKANHKEGGRTVLYGYSMGGVLANHLAGRLAKDNIPVDLLITIDAAAAWKTDKVDRTVPGNVSIALNYYQTVESFVFSRGGPSAAATPDRTAVYNHNLTPMEIGNSDGSTSRIEHGNIDEVTATAASSAIISTLRKGR